MINTKPKLGDKISDLFWVISAAIWVYLFIAILGSIRIMESADTTPIRIAAFIDILVAFIASASTKKNVWLLGTLPPAAIFLLSFASSYFLPSILTLFLALPIEIALLPAPHLVNPPKWLGIALAVASVIVFVPAVYTIFASGIASSTSPYTQQCISAGYKGANGDACY